MKMSLNEILDTYELKEHKAWFDVECSKLLDLKKRAKL
jgi:hypothetical protein